MRLLEQGRCSWHELVAADCCWSLVQPRSHTAACLEKGRRAEDLGRLHERDRVVSPVQVYWQLRSVRTPPEQIAATAAAEINHDAQVHAARDSSASLQEAPPTLTSFHPSSSTRLLPPEDLPVLASFTRGSPSTCLLPSALATFPVRPEDPASAC